MSHTIFAHHQKRLRGLSHRLSKIESRLKITEKKLNQAFTWRLLLGLLTVIIGLAVGSDIRFRNGGILFLLFLGGFFYFVRYSHQLKRWKLHLQGWHNHCLRLSQRLNGKMPTQNSSMDLYALQPEETILAKDLHILGETSLFHLIDETFSSGGRKILLSMLLSPLKSPEIIRQRQDHLKMLAKKWWPLTRFVLMGQSGQLPPDSLRLQNELNRSFTGSHFSRYLGLHFFLFPLTLLLAGLWLVGFSPLSGILVWGIYFLFSIISLGPTLRGFTQAEALSLDLENLLPVFKWLESSSDMAQELTPTSWQLKPSRQLKKVRLILSSLSIQAHPLVYILINGFCPWSYWWTWRLEKWRLKNFSGFQQSLAEIENLEALASLALFHYYQSPQFPNIGPSPQMVAQQIFHPLIDRSRVVTNDFNMLPPTQLTLITGSNMSGKSTFLRTMGINQHLSMIGCPVFAESFTTFMGPVITCLQIKDSLEEGYSSFYYEVKQVKFIIDHLSSGHSFLYLIDEIFRGTNNRERLLGSQAVIRQLLTSPTALGLITTHDLELTQLEKDFSSLENGHFRDEIRPNEQGLHFSYQYHLGPCPTTNALKIMAAEGLPIPQI